MKFQVVILLLLLLANVNEAIQDHLFWKRAREGLIDLNRTPSPEISIDLNKSFDIAPEDTAGTLAIKPKRKRNPSRLEKLREAYRNRDNLGEEEVRWHFICIIYYLWWQLY